MPSTVFGKLVSRTTVPNLQRQFGETVTYARGAVSVSIDARFREVEHDISEGEAYVQIKSMQVAIKPADLVLDGVTTEPERGDVITRADGDQFEILPSVFGVVWQWSSTEQHFYHISVDRYVKSG